VKNLAPQLFRQRLLVEGYTSGAIGRELLASAMTGLAARLGLRAYAEPVIFSPGGEGRAENQGFDAFLPLIDSGISVYYWSGARFVSVLLYSCKPFDEGRAVDYLREVFAIEGEIATATL